MISSLAREHDAAYAAWLQSNKALTLYMESAELKMLREENQRASEALQDIKEKIRRVL